jgi:hypothetical protein
MSHNLISPYFNDVNSNRKLAPQIMWLSVSPVPFYHISKCSIQHYVLPSGFETKFHTRTLRYVGLPSVLIVVCR